MRPTGVGECGPKKGLAPLSIAEQHATIAQLRESYPQVSVLRPCTLLGAGRSWYYRHPTAEERAARDTSLRDAIERLVLACPGYGYRRVCKALQRDGWSVNHKRVVRVMREEALLCQLRHRFVVATDGTHGLPTYSNLLPGRAVTRRDQVWVVDITYVRLPTIFVYLACVLDACSRRCIGWQVSRHIDTDLTLAALDQATRVRQPGVG